MKYASRQELYPTPNVLGLIAARDVFTDFTAERPAFARVTFAAARFVMLPVRSTAVREVVVVVRGDVVRATVFVVRATVARDELVVVRCCTVGVLVRVVTSRVCVVGVPREDAVRTRTAASVAPMHIKHTTRNDSVFLILSYNYNDNKKQYFGASGNLQKNKKIRHFGGINSRRFVVLVSRGCVQRM